MAPGTFLVEHPGPFAWAPESTLRHRGPAPSARLTLCDCRDEADRVRAHVGPGRTLVRTVDENMRAMA